MTNKWVEISKKRGGKKYLIDQILIPLQKNYILTVKEIHISIF